MQREEEAIETLMPLDEREELGGIGDFLSYAYFDARPYPNLMALLDTEGVEPRNPREIPYRCIL
jgi:hypothetical protein